MATVDLNLLRALHVLLQERSVTRAADRLFVTQSAMSKSLLRLRDLFDDPLFIRSPSGLVPTSRAMELIAPLHQIFTSTEDCFAPLAFDLRTASVRIRIAAPEQFALAFMAELVGRIAEQAPQVSVESQNLSDEHIERLSDGRLDFAVSNERKYPECFRQMSLCTSRTLVWCRKNHPLARKRRIGLADVLRYPEVTFHDQNVSRKVLRSLEHSIAKAGLRRRILLDTNQLVIALNVLKRTDALMLAPEYLQASLKLFGEIQPIPARRIAALDHLRIHLSLIQHERSLRSPLHRWIAEQIAALALPRSRA